MYEKNPYYLEALADENKRYVAKIKLGDLTLFNENISKIKYDLNICEGEKFKIGGCYGATVTAILLNFEGELDETKFENKEFEIELKISTKDLYTVGQFDKEKVEIINNLAIKHLTSLWIPQGKFYPTKITKNENETITIELIDKIKYLEDIYVCNLQPPFTLKQLYDDVHAQFQIKSDTLNFYNEEQIVENIPKGYTGKQILGYISECACGVYFINRFGNGEIREYQRKPVKEVKKGVYKKFLPAENYIKIQKISFLGEYYGSDSGYVLELDENNPFITENIIQGITEKMLGFEFITYTFQSADSDVAMDVCDAYKVTNKNDIPYVCLIMRNSWEFNGAVSQTWSASGESELNNSYSTKGPITEELKRIVKEEIPNIRNETIEKATELLTKYNGGYVVKKDGELFISDNEDIDKAQHIWRWNINGLGYSSTGINGPYGTAITMDGKIVADFIAAGTMNAERIKGGTLTLGGENNTNGSVKVVDAEGNNLVTISKDGLVLSNGTKLIGNGGVLSNLQFKGWGISQNFSDIKTSGEFIMLGFMDSLSVGPDQYDIFIDVEVPNNFIITEAYITLRHIPWIVDMIDGSKAYGYARNVKCYIASMEKDVFVAGLERSEYSLKINGLNFIEIENCFDNPNNSFTAEIPSNGNYKETKVVTKNIANNIDKHSRIKIATENEIPGTTKACFEQTGFIYAQLNIYGYLS